MALYHWNPATDFGDLRSQMNRLFDNFYTHSTDRDEAPIKENWRPYVDILEKEDALLLIAELPGVPRNKIKLNTADGVLTLSGEKDIPENAKNDCYHCSERYFGPFERRFSLPSNVDISKINAEYKDGILKILLPKSEEAKPKEIEIHAN